MTKGERIRIRREEIGLSQTELADLIGVSRQTMYKYETDIVTNIPYDKIENLALALKVSEAYFFGWDEKKMDLSERSAHLVMQRASDPRLTEALEKYFELPEEAKQNVLDYIQFVYQKLKHWD